MAPHFRSALIVATTLATLAGPAFAESDTVERLQASIRNSVAVKGRAFEIDIRGYFEAFLLVRSCNSLHDRGVGLVDNTEMTKVRWWMHTFQSALKLEAPTLGRVGIRSDELWSAAESNTETFRKRAAATLLSRSGVDALTASELGTTCRTAIDVFHSGEQGGPTKLSF